MTLDLFAQPPRGRRGGAAARNEALARAVAAGEPMELLDAGERRGEWQVSEVNALAREVIEGALPPLWIVGEVANFTRARSGHCYFSLRDELAQIRCVMWRDEARRLPTSPAEGMQVRVLGRLTLYEARGEFQMVVSTLDGVGEGLWKLAFDRLRATLDAEGLTAPERKRSLPRLPETVGVVTSADGAALRDVITVIRRRAPWTRIVLSACRVQGDGAAEEVAAAIARIDRLPGVDLLIVGRGGGSVEDLWAFNEERVARAIAAASVPVISAVGHETDVTIADLVADLRAPTPSAAAEAAVPDAAEIRRRVRELGGCIVEGVRARIADARSATAGARDELRLAADAALRERRERLARGGGRLHALSPLATLGRGYAVPLDARGRVKRRAAEFVPGEPFSLRVADGEVACRVTGDAAEDPASGSRKG